MIGYLKGKLVEKSPTHLLIECNGVGYHVHISLQTYSKIGAEELCKVHTHLSIKEDAHVLYGFFDEQERKLFRQLISVSGVGANTAMLMLSSLSPDELQNAIVGADYGTIQRIKGIGAKTAQRIVIDLKDKLMKGSDTASPIFMQSGNTQKEEALSALVTLGFMKNNAEKVIDQILKKSQEHLTVEKLIKAALQNL
jgi:Holliday junction DNA helicase RuvA